MPESSQYVQQSLRVLAFDTSTDQLACALSSWNVNQGVSSVTTLAAADHLCRRQANVELVSCAQRVIEQAGLTMDKLDALVVGRGPGSFTGVRIGISTAKGMACALGLPLYGVSTLDATAWLAWHDGVRGKLAVVDDAMRKEVYPAIYVLSEQGVVRLPDAHPVVKADACVAAWAARSDAEELILCGNGLVKYRSLFEEAGFKHFCDEKLWYPTGESLVQAAAAQPEACGSGDPALVLPVYTRLSDAEENERKRLGLQTPATVATTGVAEALADRHLQLRPMSINDLEAVSKLELESYKDSAHDAWTQQHFAEALEGTGGSWWIAHDLGSLVGFACGHVVGDEFEIDDVVVAADHRRQGIAKRLLARIAYDAHVLNAQRALLEVDVDNEAARSTYSSLGFEEQGLRKNYYGSGHDALLMSADLPLGVDAEHSFEHVEPAASIRPWPIVCGPRDAQTQERLVQAGELILAIESSCDETAMAIVDAQGTICANVVATSIDFHARFGGVVPEIASRKHVEALVGVYEEVMAQAGAYFGCDTLSAKDLTAVGVTAGPGLVGALVVGVAFAKGVCTATQLPLIPVNHLEGHLFANLFETPDLQPPFVASLVSGGNTMLVHVRAWGDYEVLGATIDDAVGEAFDKVAKALGLGYPGGPIISRLGAEGNPKAINFPRAMMHSHDYRFSLSGLKTAVITYIEGENRAGRPIHVPDLAASFEAAVIDVQVAKALHAVEETGVSDFCIGGGVAANPALRAAYHKNFGRRGVRVTVPPMVVCGDNAAMIALVALNNWRAGLTADLHLDANPHAPLGSWTSSTAPVVGTGWPQLK